MIKLPPMSYCIVKNPVVRKSDGSLEQTDFGEVKVHFGEIEVRTSMDFPDPFPLHPYEELAKEVTSFTILKDTQAIRLQALRPFEDEREGGTERMPGDEYLVKGPGTYIPRIEEKALKVEDAKVVTQSRAMKLRANKDTKDYLGQPKRAGESWIVREPGTYILSVDEVFVGYETEYVINDQQALLISAQKSFTDVYGIKRKAGDQWLVTTELAHTHIKDVYETIQGVQDKICLGPR